MQQVRDSMLLTQAIENHDLDEVQSLSQKLDVRTLRCEILPSVSVDDRTWFWMNATSSDQFNALLESMHRAAVSLLLQGGFSPGSDFSVTPGIEEDFRLLLVNREANDFLLQELPLARYSTLQIILRFPSEDLPT